MVERDVSKLLIINGVGAVALFGMMVYSQIRLERRIYEVQQDVLTVMAIFRGTSAPGGRNENLERKAAVTTSVPPALQNTVPQNTVPPGYHGPAIGGTTITAPVAAPVAAPVQPSVPPP